MEAQKKYSFIVSGEENLKAKDITIIDQKRGYSNSIYLLSVFLSLFLIMTFATTKGTCAASKRTGNKSGQGSERSYKKQTMDDSSC